MGSLVASLRRAIVRLLVRWREARGRRIERALERASERGDARRIARLLRRASLDIAAGEGRLRGRRVRRPLPTVAVLARTQFTDDARALAARLGVERVLLVPREALKAIGRTQLPADTGDLAYRVVAARDEAPMQRYRALLGATWDAFDPDGDVRMVLTANTCYWAEIELGAALDERDVALVALHKENLKSAGHAARWEPVYRDERAPFLGRAVLVQNEGERALQVRGEVAPAERITVVGMARLDAFHAHRRRTAGSVPSGDLVFASMLPGEILPRPRGYAGASPNLGLPIPDAEQRPEHLVDASLALHRVAVRVARALPGRRVVVKTKGLPRDREWVPRVLGHVAGPDGVPANLTVVHGGDAAAITREAALLAGLNTTMLLEAIAAGRPAAVLALGEAADVVRDHVIDLASAAPVLDDEDAAVRAIVTLADAPPPVPDELDATTRQVLDRWTANADGDASERVVAALAQLLAVSSTQLSTTRPSTRAAKRPE